MTKTFWLTFFIRDGVDTCLMQQPTHVLVIAHSLLLDLEYRTVCQPSCESQTLHSDNFDEHSKRIYLVTDSCGAEWQCFSCAVYKMAYLLTTHTHISPSTTS